MKRRSEIDGKERRGDQEELVGKPGQYGGYETQEFIADLYDVTYNSRNDRDINFFIDYALKTRGRILELGCGTGRVLIPTVKSGCEITGLDLSSQMLGKCREKLSQLPDEIREKVKLVQGNMVDFHTGEQYSLVTIPFRPFQHLISVEEQKSCLEHIGQHLIPQGSLILDIANCYPPAMYDPKYWAEQENQRDLPLPGGQSLRCTSRIKDFHRDQQYNDMELIYYVSYPGGKVDRLVQGFPFRYFFRYEVEHLLELCGFRVIYLFGNYNKSTFSNDSPEMIFVAEKS
jgi:SAM-dependent methyltransferase